MEEVSKYEKYKSKYLLKCDEFDEFFEESFLNSVFTELIHLCHNPIQINKVILNELNKGLKKESNLENKTILEDLKLDIQQNITNLEKNTGLFYKCNIHDLILKALNDPEIRSIDTDNYILNFYKELSNLSDAEKVSQMNILEDDELFGGMPKSGKYKDHHRFNRKMQKRNKAKKITPNSKQELREKIKRANMELNEYKKYVLPSIRKRTTPKTTEGKVDVGKVDVGKVDVGRVVIPVRRENIGREGVDMIEPYNIEQQNAISERNKFIIILIIEIFLEMYKRITIIPRKIRSGTSALTLIFSLIIPLIVCFSLSNLDFLKFSFENPTLLWKLIEFGLNAAISFVVYDKAFKQPYKRVLKSNAPHLADDELIDHAIGDISRFGISNTNLAMSGWKIMPVLKESVKSVGKSRVTKLFRGRENPAEERNNMLVRLNAAGNIRELQDIRLLEDAPEVEGRVDAPVVEGKEN